jgi:cyclic beta-1,2-glucan synthetase
MCLGIKRKADELHFEPCIPEEWDSFKMQYRYGSSVYNITLKQDKDSGRMLSIILDGNEQEERLH